jgi:hypothetical protein
MAAPKYKEFVTNMFELHKEPFQKFMLLCQDYMTDRAKYSDEFNREGKEIKAICLEWEAKLCGRMERGKNSVYSQNLSEKYWEEVRKYFPCIDEVGMKVSRITS